MRSPWCMTSPRCGVTTDTAAGTTKPAFRVVRMHRGFTVVEFLVVAAIVAILCGLVLPAVQQARESARRLHCQNNLHQLGIALHTYLTNANYLPSGWILESPVDHESQNGWSWSAMLLPQIDQAPLFNSINFNLHVGNACNETARLTLVDAFLCPTDHVPARVPFYLKANKTAPATLPSEPRDQHASPVMFEVAGASYPGVFGLHDPDDPPDEWGDCGEGVFSRNSSTRATDLLDGASHTLVVGERSARHLAATWTGMSPHEEEGPERVVSFIDFPPNDPRADESEFSSRHNGGTHFLLGDGSVRFLSNDVDRTVYRALATRSGQEVIDRF